MRRRINLDFFTPVKVDLTDLEETQIGGWEDDDHYDSQASDEQLAKLQAELAEAMEQERLFQQRVQAQQQRIQAQQQRIQKMRELAAELAELDAELQRFYQS